jgi:hypothetical protein
MIRDRFRSAIVNQCFRHALRSGWIRMMNCSIGVSSPVMSSPRSAQLLHELVVDGI